MLSAMICPDNRQPNSPTAMATLIGSLSMRERETNFAPPNEPDSPQHYPEFRSQSQQKQDNPLSTRNLQIRTDIWLISMWNWLQTHLAAKYTLEQMWGYENETDPMVVPQRNRNQREDPMPRTCTLWETETFGRCMMETIPSYVSYLSTLTVYYSRIFAKSGRTTDRWYISQHVVTIYTETIYGLSYLTINTIYDIFRSEANGPVSLLTYLA